MSRPELGKVGVGDELIVFEPRYKRIDTHTTVVTKVGRVWVDLEEVGGGRSWRLRLDTQSDGSSSGYRTRFITREQYVWEQQVEDARSVLHAAKVEPDSGSRWRDDDRILALADFIRAYDQQHPEES